MKIFIVGAGFTGMQLAKALVLERNNVVLIDNDPERVRYASDQLDCTVIEADGNDLGALGPTSNYGALVAPLKWFYMFAMLAGRLEIYTLLILVGRVCFRRM